MTISVQVSLNEKPADCKIGEFVPMEQIKLKDANKNDSQAGNWQMREDQRQVELLLKLEEFATERRVNILRAELQCIDIPRVADSGWWNKKNIFLMHIV